MTNTEIQQEALANARSGQSVMNYGAIFTGFAEKGIAQADIKPRENVLTFHAWKALGRSVKRGEHGVKVVTFVPCDQKDESGEVKSTYRKPHTTTVFHISQTELTTARNARGSFDTDPQARKVYENRQDAKPAATSTDRWIEA